MANLTQLPPASFKQDVPFSSTQCEEVACAAEKGLQFTVVQTAVLYSSFNSLRIFVCLLS